MRKTAVSKLARTAGLLTLGLLLATLVPHAGNAGTTSLGANLQLATPQGAGASREHGDYVSRGDALGTYYSFFFEVPPGLDRLVIDLFDADIGIGGSAEHAAGRDRARSAWDTSVTYSLFDPNGDPVLFPRFTTGDASSPAGADGAWLTFCDTDDTGAPWLRAWSRNTVNEQEAIELEIPDETAEDDLLIAVIARDADSNSHTNITAPVGWTELNQGHCAPEGQIEQCTLAVFYQVVTGSVPSSPQTFSWTDNQPAAGAIFAFANVDTSNPFDATNPGFAVASHYEAATPPEAPGVTTQTANALLLRFVAAGPNRAIGPPSGHIGVWSEGIGGNENQQVRGAAAFERRPAWGATGTGTFTGTGITRWRALTVALRAGGGDPSPPAAGHWELRVRMGSGDGINALGVRAHDGDPTGDGTEVPVYADSFFPYGVNYEEAGSASTREYTHYPWVTEGCRVRVNDFDWDYASNRDVGEVKLTSRTALFGPDPPVDALSGNNVWKSERFDPFTDSNDALDYGIWTLEASIREYPTNQANYGTLYLGPDHVVPDPTSQPEPGAFRIYMPTDAGTAPVKPYLEQQLRHGCGNQTVIPNGPYPPEQGQASCFTVTVRLVNPTGYPITFDDVDNPPSPPTNVVTAHVPGGEVTYFSQPGVETAVSQGAIVNQPNHQGAGDIVWSPGTVAAQTTALLGYHILVTPTTTGWIDVTGTDLSNGTRARYVDETGNTTQPRAISQLGPLCQLSTGPDAPTPAVVTDLRAAPSPEGVVVSWETASEVGTASLALERLERGTNRYVPVGEGPLHADPAAAAGSIYQLLDRGADPGAVEVYRVVEREVWGGVRVHGPFFARAADSPRVRRNESASVAPRPLPVPARQPAVPLQVSTGRSIRPPVEAPAPAGLKIGVAEAGLVQLRAGEIASGLGLPVAQVTARLASGGFALTRDGEPVAWTVADGNAGLLFFGEGVESPYSREAVYVLRPGAGVRMQTTAAKVVPGETTSVLPSVASAEEDRFSATVVASDPESDYWYWEVLQSGDPGSRHRSFSLDAPDARPDFGPATLRLGLQGASAGGHRVAVSLNGFALGEVEFAGLVPFAGELPVPAGIVRSGENRIDLEALSLPGGKANDLFADRFELVYPRRLAAYSDALELTAESTGPVSVDGFGWGEVVVLDLAAPLRPRLQQGTEVRLSGDGFRATFAAVAGRRYHVASRAGYRAPAWTRPLRDAGLLAPGRGADYLVITAEPLRSAAGELAALRAAAGLQTAVVTVEEIYDELAGGFPTPHAIRELLVEAAARWQPAPRYVVLAGSGHFDYRDLLGNGGNWVPPLLTGSQHGLFAADGRFADLTGEDWVPEVAIGRIPARTAAELSAYVTKLAAYEAGLEDASGRALLVADNAEPGLDFAAGLEELTEPLPADFEQAWVELVPGQVGAARAALFSGLASGANLLAYSGHGGIDRLAAEGLLTLADLPSLPAAGELPVMVALSCVLNRFELPNVEPLGARLVMEPESGAVAVWSASGLSSHPRVEGLGRLFFEELRKSPGARLGDLMREAEGRFALRQGSESLSFYNLLGDPALRVAEPPSPPPPPPGEPGAGE